LPDWEKKKHSGTQSNYWANGWGEGGGLRGWGKGDEGLRQGKKRKGTMKKVPDRKGGKPSPAPELRINLVCRYKGKEKKQISSSTECNRGRHLGQPQEK